MISTLRPTVLTMVYMLALSLLVACGGDDDNDNASPTNTAAVVAASPTATASPDADDNEAVDDASPTTDSESSPVSASPTGGATASPTRDTSRPVATRAAEPTPTESDDTGSDTDLVTPKEEALLAILLEQADLPEGWTVESAEGVDDNLAADNQICGAASFPRQDQKIAEVEGEYSFDSVDAPLFLLQNLVQFPEDIALDAMDWAREASSCTEWTDDEGSTIQMTPLESPALGDDSHAVRFSFGAGDGTIVEGDWVFIRVGGMISTIAYLGQQGSDLAPFYDIMVTATAKMKAGSGDAGARPDIDPEVQAILLDMLLTQDEVPGEWTLTSSGPGEEDDRETAFCNVPDFPAKDTRYGDAEAVFEIDPSNGPFVTQQISAFPEDVVLDAMAYVRETLSCSEWTDEETGFVFTVNPAYDPEIGEESVAVSFTLEVPGGVTGAGEAFFVRVGNYVMTVTAISLEPMGPGKVLTFAQTGTDKIEATLR